MFQVILDTVEFEDPTFQSLLAQNGIKARVITEEGPGGGWPEVLYSCEQKLPLVEMIENYFGCSEEDVTIEEVL